MTVNRSNIVDTVVRYHHLAERYAELGQFDDAWRCIGEAMTAVETTRKMV